MQDEEWMDDYDRQMLALVDQYGVAIQHVGADDKEPPFTYTVGLAALPHPEFLTFALPPAVAQPILNNLAASVLTQGAAYEHGDVLHQVISGFPVRLVEITDPSDYLTMSNRFYRPSEDQQIAALQVVFPDKEGRWPWEPGSTVANIPILGVVPDEDDGTEKTLDLQG